MKTLIWILQLFLGVYFLAVGILHFIVPDGLPELMSWMYELSQGLHIFSGVAEILAGIGLLLPILVRQLRPLIPLAALGLVVVMIGAVIWHATRGEAVSIINNLVMAALAGFVAYGRWRLHPLDSAAPSS